MPTRNVVLMANHGELIAELVASGRYQNTCEILRDSLRLVEERDAREAAKLAALRTAPAVGVDAMESGAHREFGSFEALCDYLRAVTDEVIRDAVAR